MVSNNDNYYNELIVEPFYFTHQGDIYKYYYPGSEWKFTKLFA